MSMFTTRWSQKGSNVFVVFERTNNALKIQDVKVKLTNTSCQLSVPGCPPFEWKLFAEINPKMSQRQENDDRLVLVLPKMDQSLHWAALKKTENCNGLTPDDDGSLDAGGEGLKNTPKNGVENNGIKLQSHGDSLEQNNTFNGQNTNCNQRTMANVGMSGGTMVTHGILKGGNQTSASSQCQKKSAVHCTCHENGQDRQNEGFKPLKQINHESHKLKTVKHDWYESGNHSLVITIYVSQLDPLGVSIVYEERNLTISMKTGDEKFHLKHGTTMETPFLWTVRLFSEIEPERGSHKIMSKTLEIHLQKRKAVKWKSLLEIEKPCTTQSKNTMLDEKNGWTKIRQEEKMEQEVSDDDSRPQLPTSSCSRFKSCVDPVLRIGYTGLNNLGNTCFMNSVIQCLANTTDLNTYLLGGHYRKDINTKNPLGMKGKMVEAVFDLFQEIWSGKQTSFSPIKFKEMVGLKEPRFTDYMQHDAQEFMAFLLDILHEDVNRVVVKPYCESQEDDNRPDHVVAEESWRLHKSRNDSFIVDLFHGLFKSKLDCPECGHNSVKFDPFLFLPVPLPKATRPLDVVFHYVDPSRKPVKIALSVSSSGGTMLEVFRAVGLKMNVPINKLQVFEVYKQRVRRFFLPTSPLTDVHSNDVIFVQETQVADKGGDDMYELVVMQRKTVSELDQYCAYCRALPHENKLKRCLKCMRVGYCNQVCQKSDWPLHRKVCSRNLEVVGMPFFMCIPKRKATYKYICDIATTLARRSVKVTHYQRTNAVLEDSSVEEHQFGLSSINWNSNHITNLPPLTDQGDKVLDLSSYKLLGLDWQTDNRKICFVKVESVAMEYEEISVGQKDGTGADIRSCLQLFTEPEILSSMEAWYCPKCKEHREATKTMSIWQLPDVLILQLKRFSFKNLLWRDKIDIFVDFPVSGLDMSEFCINPRENSTPQIYDLYAVVNHHGGIFGGHYTSYVRLPAKDERSPGVGWRFCDDSHVRELRDSQQVVSKAAYVVMYKKRKLTQPKPNMVQPSESIQMEEESISDNEQQDTAGEPPTPPSPSTPHQSPTPPGTSASLSVDPETPANNSESLDGDSDSYLLFLEEGRNSSEEPGAVDDISGFPLIRYNDIFDEEGNVRDVVSSSDKETSSDMDVKDHDATMTCKESSSTSDCESSLSYTDMDAID